MPRTRYLKCSYEEKVFKVQVHLQLEIIANIVRLWDKGKAQSEYAIKEFSKEIDELQRLLDRFDEGHWTDYSSYWQRRR